MPDAKDGGSWVNRALHNAGHEVTSVQNVTDIDDPLLDRAAERAIPWQDVAQTGVERFRRDMAALRVLPPTHYVEVVESIPEIIARIELLQERGSIYDVGSDLYFEFLRTRLSVATHPEIESRW